MLPTIAGGPWVLRQIGTLSVPLNRAASNVARRLVKSGGATTRWIGRERPHGAGIGAHTHVSRGAR